MAAVVKGEYRLISDGYTLQYLAQKHCLSVSSEDSNEQYAMLAMKDSIFTTYLNDVIRQMGNERLLEPLIQK